MQAEGRIPQTRDRAIFRSLVVPTAGSNHTIGRLDSTDNNTLFSNSSICVIDNANGLRTHNIWNRR